MEPCRPQTLIIESYIWSILNVLEAFKANEGEGQ